jgi:hypothetical protein
VAFNIKTQILKNGKIVNYLHGIEHGLQEWHKYSEQKPVKN